MPRFALTGRASFGFQRASPVTVVPPTPFINSWTSAGEATRNFDICCGVHPLTSRISPVAEKGR